MKELYLDSSLSNMFQDVPYSYVDQKKYLKRIASNALSQFYNEESWLFHFKLSAKGKDSDIKAFDKIPFYSTAERYSLISALGIYTYRNRGGQIDLKFDIDKVWERLLCHIDAIQSLGDLGLFLWAATFKADGSASKIAKVLKKRIKEVHLNQICTQDLAWILTGVSFTKCPELPSKVSEEIKTRFGQHGLLKAFRSSSRFETFNTQAYGLISLAEHARIFEDRSSRNAALNLGKNLINLQGPRGEWPWLYDVDNGVVVDYYPVYSVHQDAMAPMALRALANISDLTINIAIKKSVAWVFGDNELRHSIFDKEYGLIWRSIRRQGKIRRKWFQRFAVRGMGWINDLFTAKEINKESRAYHYGWILYAFS